MAKVKLQILASDIRKNRYSSWTSCAMTKAFQRAGLPWEESGGSISTPISKGNVFIMKTPQDLDRKVIGMYFSLNPHWDFSDIKGKWNGQWGEHLRNLQPIEPADFEYYLEIPENVLVSN
jgi:hypothetical protein